MSMRMNTIEAKSQEKNQTHFGSKYGNREHDDDHNNSESRSNPNRLDRFNLRAVHFRSSNLLHATWSSFTRTVYDREHILQHHRHEQTLARLRS